jgi:hypothetical protein
MRDAAHDAPSSLAAITEPADAWRKRTMEFDYKDYRIDASPLAEGGRYFARARICTAAAAGARRNEVKWSGDLGHFGSEAEAAECGRKWAIEWCDDQT